MIITAKTEIFPLLIASVTVPFNVFDGAKKLAWPDAQEVSMSPLECTVLFQSLWLYLLMFIMHVDCCSLVPLRNFSLKLKVSNFYISVCNLIQH